MLDLTWEVESPDRYKLYLYYTPITVGKRLEVGVVYVNDRNWEAFFPLVNQRLHPTSNSYRAARDLLETRVRDVFGLEVRSSE